MNYVDILLLLVAGFGAGLMDSMAGGGGLLTLPALLATGMPPLAALGTNKLQSAIGTTLAVIRYSRAGLVLWRSLCPAIGAAALGGTIGALGVQYVSPSLLKLLIPFMLCGAILYFVFSPRMSDSEAKPRISLMAYASVAAVIGAYDGFFGPGTGSFFAVSLVALVGMGLTRATANTKVLNLTSNLVSVASFAALGHMWWGLGLLMALANMVGAWIGSHLALRHGARLIRPLLVLVSLGLGAKLVWGWFS
jgi:uncharacterized protein